MNSLLVFSFWQGSRGRRKQNEKIDLHAFCSGCCAALQPFLINCVKIFNFAAVFAESSCITLLCIHPQLKTICSLRCLGCLYHSNCILLSQDYNFKSPGNGCRFLSALTLHAVYARVIAALSIPKNKSHLEAAS